MLERSSLRCWTPFFFLFPFFEQRAAGRKPPFPRRAPTFFPAFFQELSLLSTRQSFTSFPKYAGSQNSLMAPFLAIEYGFFPPIPASRANPFRDLINQRPLFLFPLTSFHHASARFFLQKLPKIASLCPTALTSFFAFSFFPPSRLPSDHLSSHPVSVEVLFPSRTPNPFCPEMPPPIALPLICSEFSF